MLIAHPKVIYLPSMLLCFYDLVILAVHLLLKIRIYALVIQPNLLLIMLLGLLWGNTRDHAIV